MPQQAGTLLLPSMPSTTDARGIAAWQTISTDAAPATETFCAGISAVLLPQACVSLVVTLAVLLAYHAYSYASSVGRPTRSGSIGHCPTTLALAPATKAESVSPPPMAAWRDSRVASGPTSCWLNVRAFGAKGDGETGDHSFQNAHSLYI